MTAEEDRARCTWARDFAREWWAESFFSLLAGNIGRATSCAERARYLERLALDRLGRLAAGTGHYP